MKDVDDFWDELTRPLPWWREMYGVGYRAAHSLRRAPRRVRMFIQRGRRGWCTEDVWAFDHYLAGIVSDGIAHLRTETHGHPVEVCDPSCDHTQQCRGRERWDRVLEEISDGFALLRTDSWSTGFDATQEERERMDWAMSLFAKHYRWLND